MAQNSQYEWTAEPDEDIKIPAECINALKYEIVVFGKREFTFRCADYWREDDGSWTFDGVVIDTSKKDSQQNVTLKRLTYHPWLSLCNVAFMTIPAPEGD